MDENESCGLESKKYMKAVSVTEGSSMAETDLVKNTYTISKTSLMRSGAPTISKNLIENEYTSKESLVTRSGSPAPGSVLRHTFPQLEKEHENKVYETIRSYPKPFADISLPKQPAVKVNIADTVQERQGVLKQQQLFASPKVWVVAFIILLTFIVIAIALPIALVKGKEGTTGRKDANVITRLEPNENKHQTNRNHMPTVVTNANVIIGPEPDKDKHQTNKNQMPTAATKYEYIISLGTGNKFFGGTDANVFVKICGKNYCSGELQLKGSSANPFERGDKDVFKVISLVNLGKLTKIRIRHDRSGYNPDWYLQYVQINDKSNNKEYYHTCNTWLTAESPSISIKLN